MKYDISNNPFDKEAYGRLIRRELDNLKKKRDIPSAYPGSTFGLVYQECEVRPIFAIDKVLFNPPATIVFWLDGTKMLLLARRRFQNDVWSSFCIEKAGKDGR